LDRLARSTKDLLNLLGAVADKGHDLKQRLAESFVEAGKDVAVVALGANFVIPALDTPPSISSFSQWKTTSTSIR